MHIKNSMNSGWLSSKLAKQITNSLYEIEKIINYPSFLHFDIKTKNIINDINNKTVAFIDFVHSRFVIYLMNYLGAILQSLKPMFFRLLVLRNKKAEQEI